MSPITPNAQRSQEVRSLDHVRPSPAKAGLDRSDAVRLPEIVGPSLCSVMGEAIVAHYGSVKEAAYALGEVDPSLMQREFDAGKFARFDQHATTEAKAAVSERLQQSFAPLSSPWAIVRQATRIVRQQCDLIDQWSEYMAS